MNRFFNVITIDSDYLNFALSPCPCGKSPSVRRRAEYDRDFQERRVKWLIYCPACFKYETSVTLDIPTAVDMWETLVTTFGDKGKEADE